MAKLNVAPTKSSYLTLRRQLAFAREGYDLLEQKRQILIFELMSRLGRARDAERRISQTMAAAFAVLRESLLDIGSDGVDRAAMAVSAKYKLTLSDQGLMGIRIPKVTVQAEPPGAQFGVGGTSARTDEAMRRFTEILTLLGELAELENAVLRLARELRKTQRRCNALSKIFIPNYSETIGYILSSLEERERESFIILKMIKDRMVRAVEGSAGHG
ncbi:MAG: V-type ATP synthase subunit D [Planctomycetota bacterium]|jgi:V/A-type H+-transporting ATPase subunit D|nr:V-type ATP synthase subunit D [Planctomycetota bacterium]